MTENPASAENGQQQPLVVNGQYVKDLSFEVPGAPGIFAEMQGASPDINIHVDINANALQTNIYEVVLHLKVDAKMGEKQVFIAELAYAGVFTLNVPQEHLQAMALIECPRLLFPFAREIVSDLTRDGGFPPLMIQPIDFVQLFRARMEQAAAEQEGSGQVGHA